MPPFAVVQREAIGDPLFQGGEGTPDGQAGISYRGWSAEAMGARVQTGGPILGTQAVLNTNPPLPLAIQIMDGFAALGFLHCIMDATLPHVATSAREVSLPTGKISSQWSCGNCGPPRQVH